jgi:predicted RNA-binding protein associated with RNAse of E/G family
VRAGDPALLRNVWRGHVMSALPTTVVEDSPERVVLYLQQGTPIRWIDGVPMPVWVERGHRTIARAWDDTHRIFIWPRGRAHAVSFLREAATGNEACFYVDALEPWRQTALGWDTCDQELDVVAWPDLSEWFWKDEAEFDERVQLGLLSEQDATVARAELESAIADIEARRGVFAEAEHWRTWRPDPSWPIPPLPDGWDVVLGT